MSAKMVVVGIGNVLLGDDGAGVWLIQHLARSYRFTPEVELLDGGTLGLELLSYLADTPRVIAIDAARSGTAPGSVTVLHERDVPAVFRAALSAHEASLCDLLGALTLLGRMPAEFVAVGIEPLRTEPGVELSKPVHEAISRAEEAVVAQLRAWGVDATLGDRRDSDGPARPIPTEGKPLPCALEFRA